MKKQFPILIIAITLFLSTWLAPARAQTDHDGYIGIRPGDSFTYTYTQTPDDTSHWSPMSVDLPFVIESIVDIVANVSCNVTYKVSYKVLVDGLPKDQVNHTTITLTNSTNSTSIADYIYSLKSPWEVFFINNNTGIREVLLTNATAAIGTGHIAWTVNGNLDNATLNTQVDGINCTVRIGQKTSSGNAVPGYSSVLVIVIAAIPTALLAYNVIRKVGRKALE